MGSLLRKRAVDIMTAKTSSYSLNRTNDHSWIMYSNPRNGRIQVKACIKCGVAHVFSGAIRACSGSSSRPHSLEALGWKMVIPRKQFI
jgi:hypothetical protein